MGCERHGEAGRPGALSAYFDGELQDRGSFEKHLRGCEGCRAELVELDRLSQLLAVDEQAFTPDPSFVARFRLRADQSLGGSAELWRWLALRLVPVSLATLAAAVLTVVLERRGVEPFSDLESAVLALGSPTIGELAADADLTVDPLASPMALRAPRNATASKAGHR